MTQKYASDSVDNTGIPCMHLDEKLAVQCPTENIRTGREIQEVVTGSSCLTKVHTRIAKQALGDNTNDIIYTTSTWCLYFYVQWLFV